MVLYIVFTLGLQSKCSPSRELKIRLKEVMFDDSDKCPKVMSREMFIGIMSAFNKYEKEVSWDQGEDLAYL